jgi:hypothetical protein
MTGATTQSPEHHHWSYNHPIILTSTAVGKRWCLAAFAGFETKILAKCPELPEVSRAIYAVSMESGAGRKATASLPNLLHLEPVIGLNRIPSKPSAKANR